MFSWTRFRTASCPFTSVNRVSMSSGMYVWTPPFDMNQKIATNCRTPIEMMKTTCRMPGSACIRSAGARRTPSTTLTDRCSGPNTYVWEM